MRGARVSTAVYAFWRDDPRLQDLCDHTSRAFFMLLLLQLDEWGRAPGDARRLHSLVWATMGTLEETQHALDECLRVRLVELYESEGRAYLWMPDWDQHAGSRGKKSHRHKSVFPAPPAQAELALVGASAPVASPSRDADDQDSCQVVSASDRPVRPERPVLAGARARLSSDSSLKSPSSTPGVKSLCIPCDLEGDLSVGRAPNGGPQAKPIAKARAQVSRARASLVEHWNRRWSVERRERFLWTNAHKQALYGLLPKVQQTYQLGLQGAVEYVCKRVTHAIADRDPHVRRRMSPAFLGAQWQRWSEDVLVAADARREAFAEQRLEGRAAQ